MAPRPSKRHRPKCVVYTRTSSAANVGNDKDSESRQVRVCLAHAERCGYEVMGRFSDPCVSGTDALFIRQGFSSMVNYCQRSTDVSIIVVESGDRFARDLLVQETGLQWLRELHLRVETTDNSAPMDATSPAAKLLRQVLGAVHEFTGAQVRERLSSGREKKLQLIQADGHGVRSLDGNAKLGGPSNSFQNDPELYEVIKNASKEKNINVSELAKKLKKRRPKQWCVRSGPNKGKVWSCKHVSKLLGRFVNGKDKAKFNQQAAKLKTKNNM